MRIRCIAFKTTDPKGSYPSQSKLWAPPTHGCVGADGLESNTTNSKKE